MAGVLIPVRSSAFSPNTLAFICLAPYQGTATIIVLYCVFRRNDPPLKLGLIKVP